MHWSQSNFLLGNRLGLGGGAKVTATCHDAEKNCHGRFWRKRFEKSSPARVFAIDCRLATAGTLRHPRYYSSSMALRTKLCSTSQSALRVTLLASAGQESCSTSHSSSIGKAGKMLYESLVSRPG